MRHVGKSWRELEEGRGGEGAVGEGARNGHRANCKLVGAAEATTLPAVDATKGNWSSARSAQQPAACSLQRLAFWVAVMPALHLILQQPLCLIDRRPTPATTLRQPCGTRFNCCILLLRLLLLLSLWLLFLLLLFLLLLASPFARPPPVAQNPSNSNCAHAHATNATALTD